MPQDPMKSWEATAAAWVRRHVAPELLDAWLFSPNGDPRPFDEVWADLEQARATAIVVEPHDLEPALADLYCAAYRWHLVCASRELDAHSCHRLAMIAAVTEVHTTQRSLSHRERAAEVA
jgi:hypothetical protein